MGMKNPLVITHAACADGHCCKWLLSAAFPEAEFFDAYYGRTPPDCTGRQVVIADFSYKRPEMEVIYDQCEELVVLDHHQTAEAELAGFGGPKATVVFDMGKSGGRLVWEWLMRGAMEQFNLKAMPKSSWLVDYSEDRDLWRWALPHSKEVNAALSSYPQTVEAWSRLNEIVPGTPHFDSLVAEGRAILRYQGQLADKHVSNARRAVIAGWSVPVVNATVLFSEVAGKLSDGEPFAACWFRRQDGLIQWSLRSRDGGLDVSQIAAVFGGGGHRQAAGFQSKTVEEVTG